MGAKETKPAPVAYKVYGLSGKGGKTTEVGSIDLDPTVFSAKLMPFAVQATVRWQLAKRRAGTHSTLSRSMMKGGGKKPFKQKGTGSARAGSGISPLWTGGAVVFGPHPRDYSYRLNRRTRQQALATMLTEKANKQTLIVVDSLDLAEGRSREMAAALKALGIIESGKAKRQKVLVVISGDGSEGETRVTRATRNIAGATIVPVAGVNCYDLMRHKFLVIGREELNKLTARVSEKH